jgi:uncharacterized protein (DUF2062 family)
MKNWLNEKLFLPLLRFLKQGISPQKLALTISIGTVVGISPLFGLTTLICLGIALIFRLNVAAMQLINYAVYPLQLILLVPYFQLGAFIFGSENTINSLSQLQRLFEHHFWTALQTLGWLLVNATVVWFLFALPLGMCVYAFCVFVFRKYHLQ